MGVQNRNPPPQRMKPVVGNCAVVLNQNSPSHQCPVGGTDVTLQCGCKIPVIASACAQHDYSCNLPVVEGYVGRSPVKVLRDSGCNGVVVRRSLVPEDQLTGKTSLYADGPIRH